MALILWMALFSWVPISVDWTKMAHSWGSKFVAIEFSFINFYRQSLFRGYWNSWIGPATKTKKIGTPRKFSHPQYVSISLNLWWNMFFQISGTSSRTHVELPYYSKFLLIAAYLASYNPAKSDKKFFAKVRKHPLCFKGCYIPLKI